MNKGFQLIVHLKKHLNIHLCVLFLYLKSLIKTIIKTVRFKPVALEKKFAQHALLQRYFDTSAATKFIYRRLVLNEMITLHSLQEKDKNFYFSQL